MRKLFLFILSFTVIFNLKAQEFTVSPTIFNILYAGTDNPVQIIAEGYDCDDITVEVTGGTIKKIVDCDYIINPGNSHEVNICLKGKKDNELKLLGSTIFRVKDIPAPIPVINNQSGGKFPKSFITEASAIYAELRNFDLEVRFIVESFSVMIFADDTEIYKNTFKGNKFPSELKKEFQDLRIGYKLVFTDVQAVSPSGKKYTLKPITFTIK